LPAAGHLGKDSLAFQLSVVAKINLDNSKSEPVKSKVAMINADQALEVPIQLLTLIIA